MKQLEKRGLLLWVALREDLFPGSISKELRTRLGVNAENLPSFRTGYQAWYSEAHAVVKQLLPDRLDDFVRHYNTPKGRKTLTNENYVIEDCLQGLSVKNAYGEQIVGPEAAISRFEQQRNILQSANARFESTLFDIRHLLQAELFDSELDAAHELLTKGFLRAAGAVAGVVLEAHLGEACAVRGLKVSKNATISHLNDALKKAGVVDVPQWRFVQRLGDLRNLCDHDKTRDPTKEEVDELIRGVSKITKTLY